MSLTASQIAICLIGLLHVLFMLGELYPWSVPKIMELVLRKWPRELDLSANDQHLVSMVVHNAGIYNGIVAAGLFAAAWVGPNAYGIQVTLLAGGIVAGVFGAATLSKATIFQAICGAIALVVVICFHT
jgi:uncharacterized membrane protein